VNQRAGIIDYAECSALRGVREQHKLLIGLSGTALGAAWMKEEPLLLLLQRSQQVTATAVFSSHIYSVV